MRSKLRSLRSQFLFPTVCLAIAAANRRAPHAFRVVHFSVQADHVHLVVEALDKRALSAGMRGLAVRIARHVNRLAFRRGALWADRWHGRALTTPRAVRHAIVYVLNNFRKHHPSNRASLDPFSSAPYFEHFAQFAGAPIHVAEHLVPRALAPPPVSPPTLPPETWLLRSGWLRHGPLSAFEKPRAAQ